MIILLLPCTIPCNYGELVAAETVNQRSFTEENYTVDFVLDSDTEEEYNARIIIKNTGSSPIESWRLSLEFQEEISNIYNASISSHEGDTYIIKADTWNQDIPVNEEVSFGFSGSKSGSFSYPTSICIPNSLDNNRSKISTERYSTSFDIDSSWNDGCIVTTSITNKSEATIKDWLLEFSCNNKIESVWDATLISQSENKVIIQNPSYHQNMEPKETVTFQFQITSREGFTTPSNICLQAFGEGISAPVVPVEPKVTIEDIYIENEVMLVDETTTSRVSLSLNGMTSEDNYNVKIFSNTNDGWTFLGQLKDNGNLDVYGDEIKNDGVFSNYISLSCTEPGSHKLKFVVYENDEQVAEEIRTIIVVTNISDENFNQYDKLAKSISSCLNEYAASLKSDEKGNISDVIEYIYNIDTESQLINQINKISDFTAEVFLNSGLSFYVQLTDNRDMETMRRGSGEATTDTDQEIEQNIYYDYTLSKDVLLWSPFDTEWGNSDETDDVVDIVNESLGGNKLTLLSDARANVESLSHLDSYGLIILSTHGINGDWLVTGEEATNSAKYQRDILTGKISTFVNVNLQDGDSKSYFMVNSSWFSSQELAFPNSIILNNSCESTKTDKLWKAFQKNGAKTYLGYTGSVTNDYVTVETTEFISGLLCENKSVQESFECSFDAFYDDGEFMNILGAGNMKLPFGIMNPDFENKLHGWSKDGDGRVIAKLGDITPTSGNKMAIISTGLGYTLEKGSISQKAYIPEEATTITFDWNFLSEEFLEYIGSQFDNPFSVELSVSGENSRRDTVLELSVNKVAEMFEASESSPGNLIHVSPDISFDQGDVWMTGWQSQTVDLSKYAGEFVTLTFSVRDAADTEFTTAVLIDNIRFDAIFEMCGNAQSISDDYSASILRGKYAKNGNGKSYILYRPNDENYKEGFPKQAKKLKKIMKYRYGYTTNNQVIVKPVTNEKEFVSSWNSMTGIIDSVSLLFHSNYYALILSNERDRQNITCSSDKKVGTDPSAFYVGDLERKTIKTLNINGCNSGLLDAINVEITKTKGKFGAYTINGNIAQCFLNTQNISEVIAWDGSVSYYASGNPKLSRKQITFVTYTEELKDVRVYIPKRKKTTLSDILYRLPDSKLMDYQPNGKTTYYKKNGYSYVKYAYQKKISYPSTLIVPLGAPSYKYTTVIHKIS